GSYRGGRKHVVFVAVFGYLAWAVVPMPANEGRYLTPIVPLMALAAGLVLEQLGKSKRLLNLGMVAVSAGFFYQVHVPKLDRELLSKLGTQRYFESINPGIVLCQRLNRLLPAKAKVYFMFENKTLGLERDSRVDSLYEAPASLELIRSSRTADEAI